MNATYFIHDSQFPKFKERLLKLGRKAERNGLTPVTLTVTGETKVVKKKDGLHLYHGVVVEGVAPAINGWKLAAKLDHSMETGTILRTVPGVGELPASYRTAKPSCDHCNTMRPRGNTFLLQNDAGDFKQVGGNCLADFLGSVDPHQLAQWATYAAEVEEAAEEGMGFGGAVEIRLFTSELFSWCASVTRVEGRFTSRKTAAAYNEKIENGRGLLSSTSGLVMNAACPPRTPERRATQNKYMPTEADVAQAELALDWARKNFCEKAAEARSDYEHNVAVVIDAETVQAKHFGIACSAFGAYITAMQVAAEKAARASKPSTYMGKIGERLVFRAKAMFEPKSFNGQFGTTYLYKLVTSEGQLLTWFSSGRVDALDTREEVELIGTVKAHEMFRNEAQTVVTRCSIADAASVKRLAKKKAKEAASAAKIAESIDAILSA